MDQKGFSVVGSLFSDRLLDSCRKQLEARTAEPPHQPTDYQRNGKLSCSCADCAKMSQFLAHPEQAQARFPVAKQRRQHLHEIIDQNHCDLLHVTERRGRPFTLVCTKTTASYDAERELYERDLRNLSSLIELEQKMPS